LESCENSTAGDDNPLDADNSVGGDFSASSSGVDSSNSVGDDDSDPSEGFTTYKDDSALRDQQSTGRKRAAKMYPLDETVLCEWASKKNCGGGKFPIVGCLANLQQARHHGPSKNTLDNEKGNVHRICHSCHNRWHTLNDEGYIWGGVYEPHEPREATPIDIGLNEEFWAGRKIVKAKD
jgi:hypothetical protein